MKGTFENNPTLHTFRFTWNVSLLLNSYRNMEEIQAFDTQKLTQTLVMLMKLISRGQRAHITHSIRASDIKILENMVIPIVSPVSNKNWHFCVSRHITKSQSFVL